jgi:predicted acyl esterase
VKVEKDVMVPMRNGVHLAVDIYRPDVEGEKFPAILSFAGWGKELQMYLRKVTVFN